MTKVGRYRPKVFWCPKRRRGWPSCKQTQDARREVDCRAAKGHSTPHPSCRGGTRGHRCPGRRGKGGKGAHHPSIDCPAAAAAAAAAAVDAGARWNWGRRLPLFSCQPRFRCSGKARLRCRARECRRYFEDEGEQGDDLGPFPHTSALLRSGAAVQLGGGGGWMDIGESTSRYPLPQEFPPQHGQCSSRPPPPEGVCVTAFYWLGLFDAWLRWHVIGRREGWVEELTLHSPPPVSRLQANKHMAPSHAPAKRWASHDRSSTLGSSAAAAAAKVPRALSSASIAMDPSSLDACLNWWRR